MTSQSLLRLRWHDSQCDTDIGEHARGREEQRQGNREPAKCRCLGKPLAERDERERNEYRSRRECGGLPYARGEQLQAMHIAAETFFVKIGFSVLFGLATFFSQRMHFQVFQKAVPIAGKLCFYRGILVNPTMLAGFFVIFGKSG